MLRMCVVMPVYNGEEYVAEAVRSVLAQTFTDFELTVIDDGSTDHTGEVLAGFSDARLHVIRFPEHRGLVPALNAGICESESELIARMDADDLCTPQRFERQVAFLDTHPEIGICGTWARTFGHRSGVHRLPVEPEHVRARLFFGGAMDHPSLMMRRAFLEQHSLAYNDEFTHCEDFDFLSRAAELTKLANLPEFLLLYREHNQQVSEVYKRAQRHTEARLMVRQLRLLMPDVTRKEEDFHVDLARGNVNVSSLAQAEQWLLRLEQANHKSARYDVRAFHRELCRKWYYAHAQAEGLRCLMSYWKSPLVGIRDIGLRHHAAMIKRYLFRRPAGARLAANSTSD